MPKSEIHRLREKFEGSDPHKGNLSLESAIIKYMNGRQEILLSLRPDSEAYVSITSVLQEASAMLESLRSRTKPSVREII